MSLQSLKVPLKILPLPFVYLLVQHVPNNLSFKNIIMGRNTLRSPPRIGSKK